MEILDVLRRYVEPAAGCTEAAAVALAAAAAREPTGGAIRSIEVVADKNVLRNALSAVVPGAAGEPGIKLTAALGAVGGDPHLGLQVLNPVDEADLSVARGLVAEGAVSVRLDKRARRLSVQVTVRAAEGTGRAVIEDSHANITAVELNGRPTFRPAAKERQRDAQSSKATGDWVRNVSVSELISRVRAMEPAALEYTRQGIEMNKRVADEGLAQSPGLGIGAKLACSDASGARDLGLAAQTLTAAAVDARMAGLPLPVMTSSGSGNQGIMITLPSLAVARAFGLPEERLVRSVALGHLLLARFCEELGPLTPLCGSALHAAAASSAAITHLLGGGPAQVEQAVAIVLGTQAGILCDGAKPSCAVKAASGAQLAVHAAQLAMANLQVGSGNGLMGRGLVELIEDVVVLAEAMEKASDQVLDILARDAG